MTTTLTDSITQTLVSSCLLQDFFETDADISLPDYQRAYVWDREKLKQLFQDLKEHFISDNGEFDNEVPPYYLGTVLLYEKNPGQFEIIDGQQRITTLLITDFSWNKEESYLYNQKWNLNYASLLSSAKIKDNFQYLNQEVEADFREIKSYSKEIFAKTFITVIITREEDEAFTFFDSQNNRGVSLSAVDFLKSYHLRELKKDIDLQKIFAKKWDSNNTGQFLNILFSQVLWRNRNWKGNELNFENKDAILESFQKKTIRDRNDNKVIALYPNVFNSLASKLTFESTSGVSVSPNNLHLQTTPAQYPFAIRQPIQKGIGFFLYTEKYNSIYKAIFKDENRFTEFRYLYHTLYRDVSYYLRKFFELATVTYYDKFKDEKLLEFGLWLDFLLGSYRIGQKSIVARTILKIVTAHSRNLLDVIEMAYTPEEVFEYMQKCTEKENYTIEDLGNSNSVRNHYKQNTLNFYKKVRGTQTNLKNKENWIHEIIAHRK
jgi:hypothetical protein